MTALWPHPGQHSSRLSRRLSRPNPLINKQWDKWDKWDRQSHRYMCVCVRDACGVFACPICPIVPFIYFQRDKTGQGTGQTGQLHLEAGAWH
jgi:hypothetical protein